MADPTVAPWRKGKLRGTLYTFPAVGDELPLHDHDAATAHITVITRGAFDISGPGWTKTRGPGPVLLFDPGNPHRFVAKEAGSAVLNIMTDPAPDA